MIGLDEINTPLRQRMVFLALPIVYFGECLSLVLVVLIRWLGMKLIMCPQLNHWILSLNHSVLNYWGQASLWPTPGRRPVWFLPDELEMVITSWLNSTKVTYSHQRWSCCHMDGSRQGRRGAWVREQDNSFWWNHWVPEASHILRRIKSEHTPFII